MYALNPGSDEISVFRVHGTHLELVENSRFMYMLLAGRALAARDLVHVATCIENGIGLTVSPDRGLDAVGEVTRVPVEEVEITPKTHRDWG